MANADPPAGTGNRAFSRSNKFDYLAEQDRYLAAPSEPRYRFGFIGCGVMGLEHMLNTRLEGRASVAGIYDPAKQSVDHALSVLRKEDSDSNPTVYPTLQAACEDPDTDALIVCTPNYTHLEVMQTVAACNKAILLEKPIATTVADAYEVCRLAAAHSNIVRIGLQYRYKAIYAEAIKHVQQLDAVGQVQQTSILEHRFPFLDKVGQWNKFDAYTGGTLVEKCCHYFDLLNLFAGGTPQRVYASGHQSVNFKDFHYDNKQADGIDQASVVIDYDNGVLGQFSLCMFVPGSREELVVCGDRGRLHAYESAQLGEPNENRLSIWRGEFGPSIDTRPGYPPYIANAGHHGSTFFEHVAFVDDLDQQRYSGPSLYSAFWSVVVGATAQASITQGQALSTASQLPDHYDDAWLSTTKSSL